MRQVFTGEFPKYPSPHAELEDQIYLQIDKLLALVSVQAALDTSDYDPRPSTRNHYSLVIEEHTIELRQLIDKLFI